MGEMYNVQVITTINLEELKIPGASGNVLATTYEFDSYLDIPSVLDLMVVGSRQTYDTKKSLAFFKDDASSSRIGFRKSPGFSGILCFPQ